MPGPVFDFENMTKRFGRHGPLALDSVSFQVQPGRITGFLGPNGAGKTTALRCLLGLVTPTSGSCLIDGRQYGQLRRPCQTVAAVLEATGFHPGRTALNHLRIRARALGMPASSATDALVRVGLSDHAEQRVGQYSLGMRQRLSIAMALLPQPQALVLDEPSNGLDPAGIAWLRELLRSLAEQGQTVLVSSHLLAEVRQSVDDVVILVAGRVVKTGSLRQILRAEGRGVVSVEGPDLSALLAKVPKTGGELLESSPTFARVSGTTAGAIGHLAWREHVEIHRLDEDQPELESVYLALTAGEGEDGK
ncbi:MAG: ATP-binding cassette domain-containing protein [Candidatus Nanopelagicales bacterium]|nr:ATP-binding cassette domain-containing protein [Candidatus Nanopelagicales bacterium]